MSNNLKVVLGVLGGVVVLLLLFSVFTGSMMGSGMMGGMGRMMSGGMMGAGIFGMLLALVFWFLVIALIVALIVWVVQQIQR